MTSLYIETPGTRVRLENEHLVVCQPRPDSPDGESGEGTCHRIALADVERLTLASSVQSTSGALAALMRAGVPISFVDGYGRLLGLLDSPATADGALRLSQYRRSLDEAFCLEAAQRLISAKIHNQIRLLQKLEGNRPGHVEPGAEEALQRARRDARQAASLEEILGIEGSSTKRYFGEWAKFLPPEFPFEGRSTRPPLNPVNATISFTSAVLYNLLVGLLQRRGLDPAIGVMHSTDNRRYSLALDLLEPFRPAVIEPFVTRLFVHRLLGKGDFEPASGGIHLNRSGRTTMLFHWEKRLRRLFHPTDSESRSSMLQEFETRIVNFKRSLDNPAEFAPFHMP